MGNKRRLTCVAFQPVFVLELVNNSFSHYTNRQPMRKRRKSPTKKKYIAYKKDRIFQGSEPFRRSWQRQKMKATQHERRKTRQLLSGLIPNQMDDARMDMPLRPLRRKRLRNWSGLAVPLATRIAKRQHMRVYRTGWNFFKSPYHPVRHKARFIAFLTQLTQEHSSHARKIAAMFQELLHLSTSVAARKYSSFQDRR
ncbi:MAG: hypothetical protein MUD01_24205, partial [Chloroflexaceae bacterium]|nr:hypothetical protein [Chloroflexaceae bacterium]